MHSLNLLKTKISGRNWLNANAFHAELTEVRFELDKANSNLIDAFNERDHMKSILIGHEENEANLKSNLEAAHVQNQELHGKLDELESKLIFRIHLKILQGHLP